MVSYKLSQIFKKYPCYMLLVIVLIIWNQIRLAYLFLVLIYKPSITDPFTLNMLLKYILYNYFPLHIRAHFCSENSVYLKRTFISSARNSRENSPILLPSGRLVRTAILKNIWYNTWTRETTWKQIHWLSLAAYYLPYNSILFYSQYCSYCRKVILDGSYIFLTKRSDGSMLRYLRVLRNIRINCCTTKCLSVQILFEYLKTLCIQKNVEITHLNVSIASKFSMIRNSMDYIIILHFPLSDFQIYTHNIIIYYTIQSYLDILI